VPAWNDSQHTLTACSLIERLDSCVAVPEKGAPWSVLRLLRVLCGSGRKARCTGAGCIRSRTKHCTLGESVHQSSAPNVSAARYSSGGVIGGTRSDVCLVPLCGSSGDGMFAQDVGPRTATRRGPLHTQEPQQVRNCPVPHLTSDSSLRACSLLTWASDFPRARAETGPPGTSRFASTECSSASAAWCMRSSGCSFGVGRGDDWCWTGFVHRSAASGCCSRLPGVVSTVRVHKNKMRPRAVFQLLSRAHYTRSHKSQDLGLGCTSSLTCACSWHDRF
jgi:hypothetical protein